MVEVSTRTLQGRYLLRPSPHLNRLIVGVLARSQERWPVRLHAAAFLSNHYHLLLFAEDAHQLSRFMGYLNGNLAREIGHVYDWKGRVWSRRYHAALVSDEEAAQVARLRYILAQGTKEGLVASPREWPGVHCAKALLDGARLDGLWIDRTLESRALRAGKDVPPETFRENRHIHFDPLPCWVHLDAKACRARVEALVTEIESSAAADLRQRGKAPRGVAAILRQNPHSRPNRLKRSPAPLMHAATKVVREHLKAAYGAFFAAFCSAAERLRAGDRNTHFPEGCFPPALPFVPFDLPPRGG